ncbi:glycosyl transferase [Thermosipho melanesiensis]|uniref:Glycosyl transferase, family 4 n=2 Tax=Thermosipho melanesiensis TaxID=46541 RepID=A6LJW3_THEM4|nr:MraY family glycosyltransferase [Thermosipho melanesiensis]ABR30214.1 glycosyl transferase, family 4 [Thermosipho melanesiensis BI429]APT73412.1 glycosyl transferase [Thermosipho melanesiensis]OOC38225.1 glycosyl transferase [Thermosipho melanesiensis]OOC40054.1 glycosyl transferase [Thermosipho melanesiensis]OOC40074.1 glycosyl transferase [Thermosipho melanesiensis]
MIYSFLLSFIFTIVTIPFLRKIAFKFNIIDYPDKNLKNHEKATPYLGGMAFMGAFLLFTPFSLFRKLYVFILGILGLYDDIKSLNPWIRITLEFVIGYLVAIRFLDNPFKVLIATIFYAFLTNSVNMMDGMDGICATTSLIATVGLIFTVAYPNDKYYLIALIGTLLGFIIFNFPPAKIFMGDLGSYTIGGILGIAIISSFSKSFDHTIASLIILAPFFIDTFSSMFRRILHEKSPFSGDREHIYDKIFRITKDKRKTLLFTAVISTIFCSLGMFYLKSKVFSIIFSIILIIFLILKLKLLKYGD